MRLNCFGLFRILVTGSARSCLFSQVLAEFRWSTVAARPSGIEGSAPSRNFRKKNFHMLHMFK